MSKIVVFLSKEYMLEQTYAAIQSSGVEVDEVKIIRTSETVNEARQALENGASILIARGVQAQYIREYTKVPVVEIVMTGQELSLVIAKAKAKLNKERPNIAICGLKNMFSDTTYFNEIFDINLKMYLADTVAQIPELTEMAIDDNVDILIGGDMVRNIVKNRDIEYQFLESTEDSIVEALVTAKKMLYTAEIVRNHTADFEAVMDSTFQAIIKVDKNKDITVFNKISEEMFNINSKKVIGTQVTDLIPDLKVEYMDSILNLERDILNISIRLGNTPTMLSVLPIQNETEVLGAIVTCYRLNIVNKQEPSYFKSMHLKGFVTDCTFDIIKTKDKSVRFCVELAKNYALSRNPILIYGETGTEKEFYAQCIHNTSVFKNGPFVSVNCGGMTEQRQIELLFGTNIYEVESDDAKADGKRGALELSNGGTLFIQEVDKMSKVCQYRLFRAIHYKTLIQNDMERTQTLENRIIVSSSTKLEKLVEDGEFRDDLYYVLNSLVLTLPNIKNRENYIEEVVKQRLMDFSKNYSKFLKVSDKAMDVIKDYDWRGNIIQLESFCERLFLTTPQKLVSEEYVKHLLNELYSTIDASNGDSKVVVYKHPETEKISSLLEKNHGNRGKVAQELGISTTTLWRKMKKYGIIEG